MAFPPSRQVTQPPPLYIPSSDGRGNGPEKRISDGGQLYQVPITPAGRGGRGPDIVVNMPGGSPNRSHFSPATPDIEKGLGHFRSGSSVSQRLARSISSVRSTSKPKDEANNFAPPEEKRKGPGWIMWAILLILLVLLANVIYLDIRLMDNSHSVARSDSSPQPATNANAAGIGLPPPSASGSRTDPASSSNPPSGSPNASRDAPDTPTSSAPLPTPSGPPTPQVPGNLAGPQAPQRQTQTLPPGAAQCIQQFPGNVETNAAAFCQQCLAPFQAISPDFFNAQDPNGELLRIVNGALNFCTGGGGGGNKNS